MESEELKAQLEALTKRVEELEGQVTFLKGRVPEVDEETIMEITAAVAAYLGVKAKVKQVRFAQRGTWAAAGREAVQRRSVPHVR